MHKVYYDKIRNFTIIDVSGVKPIKKIKKEFGDAEYQTIEIDPATETFDNSNGELKKIKIK